MIKTLLDQINLMAMDLNQSGLNSLHNCSPLLGELWILWKDDLEHLCNKNGQLLAFWMSYIDMVEDVGLLHAAHEGN